MLSPKVCVPLRAGEKVPRASSCHSAHRVPEDVNVTGPEKAVPPAGTPPITGATIHLDGGAHIMN